MGLLVISSAILLGASQATALAEFYFGNCAGELEAGPIGYPSTDKTFGCFRTDSPHLDCDKAGQFPCKEGVSICDDDFYTFTGADGIPLKIVDCIDNGKSYDGHEPPPDGTPIARLAHAENGSTLGSCTSLAYGGDSKTCATFGSRVCGIGFKCQQFNT